MAISVAFQNPQTGEVRQVKVGFSWVLFMLSGVFGIPLFRRQLTAWGWVMLTYNIAAVVMLFILNRGNSGAYLLMNVVSWATLIYLGVKGNELTAKNYLALGWRFVEPSSDLTKFAKMKWRIFEQGTPYRQEEPQRVEPSWDQRP